MNISRENRNEVNATLKILIEKSDYQKPVEDTLKNYRKTASLPGFRPGKVPAGLIQKKFGKAVLVEEVNKLLSHNLSKYMVDEKLRILGEPMPNDDQQKDIDWDKDENFEFAFDIALAPEVKVELNEEVKIPYYKITVSDEMIDQQVDHIKKQLGQNVEAEVVEEKGLIRGDFVQLNENGEVMEDGIKTEAVLISVDVVKDEEIKKMLVGSKKGEVVKFDPVKAYQNRHEIGHMLNISHEQADQLNSEFNFEIKEVLRFEEAELNEELYKKIYGEETEIKTEEDLRAKVKEDIETNLVGSSEHKFMLDVRETLVDKVEMELPADFLKRWLIEVNKELTEEQIENDFEGFLNDLRWQLIKDEIIKQNEIKIEQEDVADYAKKMARSQYAQYGIYDVPDEQLESFAKIILEKPEEKENIHRRLQEEKVVDTVKEKVSLEEKEVSREEFSELLK